MAVYDDQAKIKDSSRLPSTEEPCWADRPASPVPPARLLPDFLSLSPLSNSHLMSFTTSRCELLVTMVPFTCWGTNDMTEAWQWKPRGSFS